MVWEDKVTDEIIEKLPRFAYVGSTVFEILWKKHRDGTVSFVSFRLGKRDLESRGLIEREVAGR